MPIKKGIKDLVAEANKVIETISAQDATGLHGRDDVVFIDLRDVRELWREGAVPGAYHAPRGMLEFWVDPESPYHKDVFAQEDKRFVLFFAGGLRRPRRSTTWGSRTSAISRAASAPGGRPAGRPRPRSRPSRRNSDGASRRRPFGTCGGAANQAGIGQPHRRAVVQLDRLVAGPQAAAASEGSAVRAQVDD